MNYWQILINYLQAGIPCLNVLYGEADSGTFGDLIAERVAEAARNSYMSRLTNDLVLTSVRIVGINTTLEHVHTPTQAISGANAGNSLPINCAFTVSKTFFGTRKKGRQFLPGVPEAAVDDGRLVNPAEALIVTQRMEEFRTICKLNELPDGTNANQPGADVTLGGPYFVNTGPGGSTGSAFFKEILSYETLPIVGSQSRRRDN